MLNGMPYNTPATISDETVLPVIFEQMQKNGFGVRAQIKFEESELDLDKNLNGVKKLKE